MEIVCQAYDLIQRNYVDQVSDTDLAEAAARGVRDLDGASGTGDLVCAAPTDEFGDSCRLALDEAETTTEAAEAIVAGVAKYALDPNSVYLDSDALDLLDEEQDGEIQGIGALVSAEDGSDREAGQCAILSDTCRLDHYLHHRRQPGEREPGSRRVTWSLESMAGISKAGPSTR